MVRKKREPSSTYPPRDTAEADVPDASKVAPPEIPDGLDPDTLMDPDSPRRALDAGRFGNPRKEELADQPANSDSVTDDDPMEPAGERALRDADVPDDMDDPGISESYIQPQEPI